MRKLKIKPSAEKLQQIAFDQQDTAGATKILKMSKVMGLHGVSTILIKGKG